MRRRGMTLVELLFTALLILVVFVMVWSFFRSGRQTLESTRRKLDATQLTHLRFEQLRHDLECAQVVWVGPEQEEEEPDEPGGSRILYADGREYLHRPCEERLYVGGRAVRGRYADVRFFRGCRFTVKYALTSDRSRPHPSGRPGFRERSTLVSKAFLEPMAEHARRRNHIFEQSHRWCTQGASIHYAFFD